MRDTKSMPERESIGTEGQSTALGSLRGCVFGGAWSPFRTRLPQAPRDIVHRSVRVGAFGAAEQKRLTREAASKKTFPVVSPT